MNLTAQNSSVMLDGFLIEGKIIGSLEKAKVPEYDFDDRHEIFELYNREKMVMTMALTDMFMERRLPTPRRSGDDDGVDFLLTRGSDAAGSSLSRSRRGLLPPPPPL
jgi:hypothetical protein